MQDKLCFLNASALADGYRAGTFTPSDVVDAYLARIAALDPKYHAYLAVFADDARSQAKESGRRIAAGKARALEGLPIALKDLLEMEGTICTAGSPSRRDRVSSRTATIATRLQEAGAIILGKVHTVEFAFGGWGTNQHLGAPRNPWGRDVHYTPGGSSSGSGAAVAARLAPWAIGTDTGGSVRIPASFNGIVALKSTFGRISAYGVVPLVPSLDTPGVMTRTVADAALLFDALQGEDSHDASTRGLPPANVFAGLESGVKGLRLGRIPDRDRHGVHPDTLASYDASLAKLAEMGADIVQTTLPTELASYGGDSPIMMGEAYALHGDIADNKDQPMDEAVRRRILPGAAVTAKQYLDAKAKLAADTTAYLEAVAGLDALIVPTTWTPAIPVAEVDEATTPALLTRFVNQLGLCALAVPSGFTPKGHLPLSIQIVCKPFDEKMALRIGHAFEAALNLDLEAPVERL